MEGARLKQLRLSRGKTQKELAKLVRLHQATLSKYEHDRSDPPFSHMERIAEVLRYSLDAFTQPVDPTLRAPRIPRSR